MRSPTPLLNILEIPLAEAPVGIPLGITYIRFATTHTTGEPLFNNNNNSNETMLGTAYSPGTGTSSSRPSPGFIDLCISSDFYRSSLLQAIQQQHVLLTGGLSSVIR